MCLGHGYSKSLLKLYSVSAVNCLEVTRGSYRFFELRQFLNETGRTQELTSHQSVKLLKSLQWMTATSRQSLRVRDEGGKMCFVEFWTVLCFFHCKILHLEEVLTIYTKKTTAISWMCHSANTKVMCRLHTTQQKHQKWRNWTLSCRKPKQLDTTASWTADQT